MWLVFVHLFQVRVSWGFFCFHFRLFVKERKSFQVHSLLRRYTQLQLLNQEFNRCFSTRIFPCFLIFQIPIATLDIVCITGFHGLLSWLYLALLAMFPVSTLVGIAIVFPLAGSLFSGSLQFKHSLLNLEKRKEDALTRKFARAFSPLRISVGSFTTVKNHSGLVTLGLIFYYTLKTTIFLKPKVILDL